MKKTTFGLLTLITLALAGCENRVTYTTKNENNNDVEVSLITDVLGSSNRDNYSAESHKDSVIEIYNKKTRENTFYTNLVFDKDEYLVNRMVYAGDYASIFSTSHTYIRGPENAKLFAKADSIFRWGVNFIKEEQKKEMEANIKKATDVPYK